MKRGTLGITFIGALIAPLGVWAQDLTFTQGEIDAAEACTSADGLVGEQWQLCTCAPEAMAGSVWGVGPYTSDSSVCAAARHAGAVPAEGGAVLLTAAPGQDSYEGSEANGITTRDWGSYGSSFQVASAPLESMLEACTVMPSGAETHSCHCPEAKGNTGSVWGYGPYTADSDICSAARHAGYIDGDGGDVTVLRIQGLEAYASGASNGIETSDWGAYTSSIVFDWNAD